MNDIYTEYLEKELDLHREWYYGKVEENKRLKAKLNIVASSFIAYVLLDILGGWLG